MYEEQYKHDLSISQKRLSSPSENYNGKAFETANMIMLVSDDPITLKSITSVFETITAK